MANGLDIEGLDDLVDFLDDMEISEQLERKTLNVMGDIALENIKENTPVGETGGLKNSFKKTVRKGENGFEVIVGSDKWYAGFVDWGTSKDRSNVYFMEKAVEEVEDEILDAALESLEVLFR